jgi:hypothetical protein
MVRDEVWEQAWTGRRKWWHSLRGQEILCVGCLEQRLGRTLLRCDFANLPMNNPDDGYKSERLRQRLTTDSGRAALAAMHDERTVRL